jgi:hypothetical protein
MLTYADERMLTYADADQDAVQQGDRQLLRLSDHATQPRALHCRIPLYGPGV